MLGVWLCKEEGSGKVGLRMTWTPGQNSTLIQIKTAVAQLTHQAQLESDALGLGNPAHHSLFQKCWVSKQMLVHLPKTNPALQCKLRQGLQIIWTEFFASPTVGLPRGHQ